MIFVTVGTHEQPFDRLIKYIDHLTAEKIITERIIMQTGFCKYVPEFCEWKSFYTFDEMQSFMKKARIIITHGGPSSIMMSLQYGKVPVAVPRQKKYGEDINDHQIEFVREMADGRKNIIPVENIEDLKSIILNYDKIISGMSVELINNNVDFNNQFENLIFDIMKGK